jgi:muramoyltetrapeptide carboxypeptidase LdcA involved in peptidoglycan recycling
VIERLESFQMSRNGSQFRYFSLASPLISNNMARTVSYMDPQGAYIITKPETTERSSAVAASGMTRRSEMKNLETIIET